MSEQAKWGDKPIRNLDDHGATDHRGRKWPICGCPCIPCLTAWVACGVTAEQLGQGPRA